MNRDVAGRFTLSSELGIAISVLAASIVVSVAPEFYASLFLYVPPTLYAAYKYGRRYSLATAGASVSFVLAGICVRDAFAINPSLAFGAEDWGGVIWWAVLLVIGCAWLASLLFGKFRSRNNEYVKVLRHLLAQDESGYERVSRIAQYTQMIAMELGLSEERVGLAKSAALLQALAEVDASRETLTSLAVACGGTSDGQASESALSEALTIAVAERLNGSQWSNLPVEARIIAVAETFEELTSAKNRRSGLPLKIVRNMIERESNRRFDPEVVAALLALCDRGDIQVDREVQLKSAAHA